MKHLRIVTVSLLLLFCIFALSAQAPEEIPEELPTEEQLSYTFGLGDQMLSLDVGMFIPLAFTGNGTKSTNLTLGGTGHLAWSWYLNNNMTLGIVLEGMFAFSPNSNTLFMVPITARYAYHLRLYRFEFPISLSAGLNMSSFDERFKTDAILIPGIGVYWNYNVEWVFGLDTRYWWIPQYYSGPRPASAETRFGHFLTTTFSVIYRF